MTDEKPERPPRRSMDDVARKPMRPPRTSIHAGTWCAARHGRSGRGRDPGGRKLTPARRIPEHCIIATDGPAPPGADSPSGPGVPRIEADPHDCNMCSRDVGHAGSKLMRRWVPVARAMRSSVRVDG